MKCNLSDQEKTIDAYLSGKLSRPEIEKFEEHLFNCHDCFQEVKIREDAIALIKDEGDILFPDLFDEERGVGKDGWLIFFKKFSRQLKTPRRFIYAASIMAIITLSVFGLYHLFLPSESDEIFSIEPFPYVKSHTLGPVSAGKKTYLEGMELYKSGNYWTAATKLEEAIELGEEVDDIRFYLGVCYMFQDQAEKSIEHLKIAVGNNRNSEKEHWYLGHAYLQAGDTNSAKKEIQIVASLGQARYHHMAQNKLDILRKLNNKKD